MRWWFRCLLLLACALPCAGQADPGQLTLPVVELEPGDPFPDLAFAVDGASRRLSELEGTRFVTFWASWCTPCLAELAEIQDLRAKGLVDDLTFVALSVDEDPARAAAAWARHGWADGPAGTVESSIVQIALQVEGIPQSFVIDEVGTVLGRQAGYKEGSVWRLIRTAKTASERAARRRGAAATPSPPSPEDPPLPTR